MGCHGEPAVRALYPTRSRRGIGPAGNRQAPLPEPTTALPGTAAKVAVFCLRAALGQQLFHPADPSFLSG